MARPEKNGLDYFPMDVDAGEDFKVELVEAKFGLEGFALLIKLYMKIYRNWYFVNYCEDFGLIFARKAGISYDRFKEMLDYFLEKNLFDRDLFLKFNILTSAAIQKRWLRGCEKREKIRILKEYWLIDASAIFQGEKLSKIRFINTFGVSSGRLPVETPQSKVEESRVKERRLEGERVKKKTRALPPPPPEIRNEKISEPAKVSQPVRKENFSPPSISQISRFIRSLGHPPEAAQIEAEKIFKYYEAVGWKVGRSPVVKWQPLVKRWMSNDFNRFNKKRKEPPKVLHRHPMEIDRADNPTLHIEQVRQYRDMIDDVEADIGNMSKWTTYWEQSATERNITVEKMLDACTLGKYQSYKRSLISRGKELQELLSDLNRVMGLKVA